MVLACLAYVDLNPVRAAIAETPEDSDYTSIQRRIRTLQAASKPSGTTSEDVEGADTTPPTRTQPPELFPFVGGVREAMPEGFPPTRPTHLELVSSTGQAVRDDKRGEIASDLPPIRERVRITPEAWYSCPPNSRPTSAAGSVTSKRWALFFTFWPLSLGGTYSMGVFYIRWPAAPEDTFQT